MSPLWPHQQRGLDQVIEAIGIGKQRISELPPVFEDQDGVISMLESFASAEEIWALEAVSK